MAEFVIKLADERGRVQEQVQTAATAEEGPRQRLLLYRKRRSRLQGLRFERGRQLGCSYHVNAALGATGNFSLCEKLPTKWASEQFGHGVLPPS